MGGSALGAGGVGRGFRVLSRVVYQHLENISQIMGAGYSSSHVSPGHNPTAGRPGSLSPTGKNGQCAVTVSAEIVLLCSESLALPFLVATRNAGYQSKLQGQLVGQQAHSYTFVSF